MNDKKAADRLGDYRKRDIAKVIMLGTGHAMGCAIASSAVGYAVMAMIRKSWTPEYPWWMALATFPLTTFLVWVTGSWAGRVADRIAPPVNGDNDPENYPMIGREKS